MLFYAYFYETYFIVCVAFNETEIKNWDPSMMLIGKSKAACEYIQI